MTSPTFPSVAALASFQPAPQAQPTTIYAAVIEWPDNHGRSPELILAHSVDARADEVRKVVHAAADALTDPEWREALTDHRYYPRELFTWTEEVFGELDERPFITTYERTV